MSETLSQHPEFYGAPTENMPAVPLGTDALGQQRLNPPGTHAIVSPRGDGFVTKQYIQLAQKTIGNPFDAPTERTAAISPQQSYSGDQPEDQLYRKSSGGFMQPTGASSVPPQRRQFVTPPKHWQY